MEKETQIQVPDSIEGRKHNRGPIIAACALVLASLALCAQLGLPAGNDGINKAFAATVTPTGVPSTPTSPPQTIYLPIVVNGAPIK